MAYRPRESHVERKHYRANELTGEHMGRLITVGGAPWAVRGLLVQAEILEGAKFVRLQVRRRDGRQETVTVADDSDILIHRRKNEGDHFGNPI